MPEVKDVITTYEGTEKLLYSDASNPYESIYIRAEIRNRSLTVTDSECDHGPDGGWSHGTYTFDEENTEKVIFFLLEKNPDPFMAMESMMTYEDRTRVFAKMCDEKGIIYTHTLEF